MNWVLVALLGYLVVQLAIGAWVARRITTEDDYLVAGRRLGLPLTVFTIFATWFGAETCLASAGVAYGEGFSLSNAEPMAYGVTLILMGLVFAGPLWRRKLTTLADLFRDRYSPGVERLAALIMIPTALLWAAAQLRGFGLVLTTVTTLPLSAAIGVAAAFCALYTVLGGMLADAITDLIQGAVLIVGLAVLAALVVAQQGGVEASLAAVDATRIGLVAVGAEASALDLLEEWAIPICGSVVAAELVSRVIAARSPGVARHGAVMAGGLYIVVGLVPVFLGLAAAGLVTELADSEQFLPALAQRVLPRALYVVFAGGLISAILSTVDTILLVTGGLAAHNVVAPMLGISDDARRLRMARAAVLAFGVVAWALAVGAEGVAALVEEASAFGSAGVLVVVCFGLFGTWGGPRAAAASLLGGLGTYVGAAALGARHPFITSLAAALALYAVFAVAERAPPRRQNADA